MTKNSFIFYRSFFEALVPLNDSDKLSLFNAIAEFALNQTETELEPLAKAMFTLIKPQLEANNKRYENGKKGGRGNKGKKQTESKPKPKPNLDESKPKPNKNDNVNVNANVNKNDIKSKKITLDELSISHISDWLANKRMEGKYIYVDEFVLLEKFKNYCLSKGRTYKDYIAAYRNAFEWDNVPTIANKATAPPIDITAQNQELYNMELPD